MASEPEPTNPDVDELRRLLEWELDRNARPYQGCFTLLVALAGLLLAGVLLLGLG